MPAQIHNWPRYRSRAGFAAARIDQVTRIQEDGPSLLHLDDGKVVDVPYGWIMSHDPHPGDYVMESVTNRVGLEVVKAMEFEAEFELVEASAVALTEELERRAIAAGHLAAGAEAVASHGSVLMPGMTVPPAAPVLSGQMLRHTALMLALQQAGGADSAKVVEAAGRYLRFLQGGDSGLVAVDAGGHVHQFPAPGA